MPVKFHIPWKKCSIKKVNYILPAVGFFTGSIKWILEQSANEQTAVAKSPSGRGGESPPNKHLCNQPSSV